MTAKELAVGQVWRKGEDVIRIGEVDGFVCWRLNNGREEDTWPEHMPIILDGWTLDVPPKKDIAFRAGQVWVSEHAINVYILQEMDNGCVAIVTNDDQRASIVTKSSLRTSMKNYTLSPESQAKEPRA